MPTTDFSYSCDGIDGSGCDDFAFGRLLGVMAITVVLGGCLLGVATASCSFQKVIADVSFFGLAGIVAWDRTMKADISPVSIQQSRACVG
jgi:hypothetical protein